MLLIISIGVALRWLLAPRSHLASLRDLDARTLADIGLHPSEVGSVEAEWAGAAAMTRRAIAAALRHG